MINLQNLSLAYGQQTVLRDINIAVAKGEVLAVVGPNGAGKTTLLNAVSGVFPPKDGSLTVNETEISTLNSAQRARLMAVVPQARAMPAGYTVWQTVMMGRTPYLGWLGKPLANDTELVRSALEQVGIEELSHRSIEDLSGGEQQRVLLARAIAQDTPILLLDEPTAHLDIRNQASFLSLMLSLVKQKNITVLISIHDLNLAGQIADRIALLANRSLQAIGRPNEILTQENLSATYSTPIQVDYHSDHEYPIISIELGKKQ